MGHDIVIIDNGYKQPRYPYVSFNFSDLYKKYGGVKEIHGHNSSTVIRIIDKILSSLQQEGIKLVDPGDYANWWYGLTSNDFEAKRMDDQGRKEVYYRIMYEWKMVAKEYNGYWYSDQVWNITPYEENGYYSEGKEKEYDSDSE